LVRHPGAEGAAQAAAIAARRGQTARREKSVHKVYRSPV